MNILSIPEPILPPWVMTTSWKRDPWYKTVTCLPVVALWFANSQAVCYVCWAHSFAVWAWDMCIHSNVILQGTVLFPPHPSSEVRAVEVQNYWRVRAGSRVGSSRAHMIGSGEIGWRGKGACWQGCWRFGLFLTRPIWETWSKSANRESQHQDILGLGWSGPRRKVPCKIIYGTCTSHASAIRAQCAVSIPVLANSVPLTKSRTTFTNTRFPFYCAFACSRGKQMCRYFN
jgi:hypothetical protein